MAEEKLIHVVEDICWRAIPIQYDNYSQENNEAYRGDIFGALGDFESPHYLWKRFHKNISKAMIISSLNDYSLQTVEEDTRLFEIAEHVNISFSVEILCRHQSLLLIVCAFEAYVKDCFKAILELCPQKVEGGSPEKIIKKYNFQSIDSVNKAFSWLIEYEISLVSETIRKGLEKRHKIIHESYYDNLFTSRELEQYYVDFLTEAEAVHFFLEDKGFYARIEKANHANIFNVNTSDKFEQ